MPDLRIVFMGTPEFAVPSLRILHQNGFKIVGVITAPDKPRGRGQKLGTSPVKDFARKNGLAVLQPTNLKSPDFLQQLRDLNANLQAVVAFRMLPEVVWSMPELGTFNLHASLLPQYRGAAPINWAIINGESKTGVSTFFIRHEIDTGNLIMQDSETILPDDNAGTLHDRLMKRGAELVLKTVRSIQDEGFIETPQTEAPEIKKAPKIFAKDCHINWNQPVQKLHNFIRGLSPYPGARAVVGGRVVKIYASSLDQNKHLRTPGEFDTDNRTFLRFAAQDGWLNVLDIQMEGKKKMKVDEFLRGNRL